MPKGTTLLQHSKLSELKDVVVASQLHLQEVLRWHPKDRLKLALQCVINKLELAIKVLKVRFTLFDA